MHRFPIIMRAGQQRLNCADPRHARYIGIILYVLVHSRQLHLHSYEKSYCSGNAGVLHFKLTTRQINLLGSKGKSISLIFGVKSGPKLFWL
jgi:hypothetical protein